jgi:hypothetical protein
MDALPPPPSADQPRHPDFGRAPIRRRRWMWVAFPLAGIVLVALALILMLRGYEDPRAAAAPMTSPSPSVEPLSPPVDPHARAKPFRVVLTWLNVDATIGDDGYEIRRDGAWIGSVDAGVLRFVDERVIPGRSLRYEIRTQSMDGRLSDPVSIDVSTPLPRLSSARVAGTFDVRADITSQFGVRGYDDPTFGWRLTPTCATRACTFRLRDVVNDLTMVFDRKGDTYTASFTGRLGLSCGNTPVTSSGTVELRVEKAKVIGREWRAIRLVGGMRHSETQQLGCRSSGATLVLKGKLIRLAA